MGEGKRIVDAKERETGEYIAYLPPGEGTRSLWVLGELVTYKITSHQTGGAYSLFEVTAQPGAGPRPHVQHREDEAFCVLEGEYEFLVEGHTINAGAGSLIYVPKGNFHAYSNVGEGIGRMLVSQTPGGLHEQFFEEIGEPATDKARPPSSEGAADIGEIAAIATKYGIEIPPISSRSVDGKRRDGKEGTMLRTREESVMDEEQQRYERAHARVQAIKGFYIHATAFVVVNIALLTINVLVGGVWWFYWPLIGWGIGLGLHAFAVFGFGSGGPFGRQWEERKMQEMMDKERGR